MEHNKTNYIVTAAGVFLSVLGIVYGYQIKDRQGIGSMAAVTALCTFGGAMIGAAVRKIYEAKKDK